MSVREELICAEPDGSISFGNYELEQKTKKDGFEFGGDVYKVKTFKEITKLDRNDKLAYESVPGTAVTGFKATVSGVEFTVEGFEDAQITVDLEEDAEYSVYLDGEKVAEMKTILGGKLSISVELDPGTSKQVRMDKIQ